jgi:SAM-dependent methyltransferase
MNASVEPAYFDGVFARDEDPWDYRNSWYEARKRALTLAVLPRRRYASAFEPGCANGVLTAELAPRCERLLACDFSASAVRFARERVRSMAHVQVDEIAVPEAWPAGRFDLIVISEFAYYLSEPALAGLVGRVDQALDGDGTLVACHWNRPFSDARHSADAVHRALGAVPGLTLAAAHVDADFLLHAWVRGPRSVAQIEGLT